MNKTKASVVVAIGSLIIGIRKFKRVHKRMLDIRTCTITSPPVVDGNNLYSIRVKKWAERLEVVKDDPTKDQEAKLLSRLLFLNAQTGKSTLEPS